LHLCLSLFVCLLFNRITQKLLINIFNKIDGEALKEFDKIHIVNFINLFQTRANGAVCSRVLETMRKTKKSCFQPNATNYCLSRSVRSGRSSRYVLVIDCRRPSSSVREEATCNQQRYRPRRMPPR